VPGDAAIGIDKQFAAGETGIAGRAAEDESPGAVDIEWVSLSINLPE